MKLPTSDLQIFRFHRQKRRFYFCIPPTLSIKFSLDTLCKFVMCSLDNENLLGLSRPWLEFTCSQSRHLDTIYKQQCYNACIWILSPKNGSKVAFVVRLYIVKTVQSYFCYRFTKATGRPRLVEVWARPSKGRQREVSGKYLLSTAKVTMNMFLFHSPNNFNIKFYVAVAFKSFVFYLSETVVIKAHKGHINTKSYAMNISKW